MSLLLDALHKKSGNGQQGTGLTLEEPAPRAASSAGPYDPQPSATRAAGETLFAAKKKKAAPKFRWNLGLVPTTLVLALVFGAGYGFYVWWELQPPSRPVVRTPPPPPPAPVAVFVAPPAPLPAPIAETVAATPQFAEPAAPKPAARATARRAPRAAASVPVQRLEQTDATTPALLEAWHAYQRGEYAQAAQGYRQVLGRDANNRDALLGLAACSQQQGQDEAAQHYFRRVLALDPRDPVANAALSAYEPSGADRNESRLRRLLDEQPRSAALHFALGNLYADQANWTAAQQAYFNAHTLEPNNAQFIFNLAVSLDHLGQTKLAARHYQLALQLDVAGNSGFDRNQAQQRLNELSGAR